MTSQLGLSFSGWIIMAGGKGRSDDCVCRGVARSTLTLLAASPLTPRSALWPGSHLCPASLGTPRCPTSTPGRLRPYFLEKPCLLVHERDWWCPGPNVGLRMVLAPPRGGWGAPGREGVSEGLVPCLGRTFCVSLVPLPSKRYMEAGRGQQSPTDDASTGKRRVLCAVTRDCWTVWKSAHDGACGHRNRVQHV